MSEMGGSYREVALRVLQGGQHVPSPPPYTVPSPPDTKVILAKVCFKLKGKKTSHSLKGLNFFINISKSINHSKMILFLDERGFT